MDIELGIQNVARPVTFSVDDSESSAITEAIGKAVESGAPINVTDDKGRHIVVPASALGYAIVGSETKHAVGFGAL